MVGSICFWLVGYAFAYGESAGGFIGASNFLLLNNETDFSSWFFQFVFSATAATVSTLLYQIDSGAVAERVSFEAYHICLPCWHSLGLVR
jgi:Amt family ammonium transporter